MGQERKQTPRMESLSYHGGHFFGVSWHGMCGIGRHGPWWAGYDSIQLGPTQLSPGVLLQPANLSLSRGQPLSAVV